METKQFIFPESGRSDSNLLAAILPSLCNKGVDTAALAGMLNGNNGGLFGGRGFEDIIALIIVAAIFGNGNFGFGNNGNNSTERQMIMDAIQRNGIEVSQLASTLGCSTGRIENAVNAVATQICNLSAQSGQNTASIINTLLQGNQALSAQLCSCCCDLKQLVTSQGFENRLTNERQTNAMLQGFNTTNVGMERGFSSVAYAAAQQTCDLKQNADDNTRAILAKLDAIEDSRKDREIAALTAQNTTLTSRAERQAELAPIYSALADLKCNQPEVKKIACPEQYVRVDNGINAHYALIPNCGYGYGFGAYNFPFANGFTNAF